MALTVGRIDYGAFLQSPSDEAFLAALSIEYCINFSCYIQKNAMQLLPPEAVANSFDPTLTQVRIRETRQMVTDAIVSYHRLDIGDYLSDCSVYVPESAVVSQDTFIAWLMDVHKLYFTAADFTLAPYLHDLPEDPLVTLYLFQILPGNYVWMNNVQMRAVAANHLALFARPGTATGIRPSDVGVEQANGCLIGSQLTGPECGCTPKYFANTSL